MTKRSVIALGVSACILGELGGDTFIATESHLLQIWAKRVRKKRSKEFKNKKLIRTKCHFMPVTYVKLY